MRNIQSPYRKIIVLFAAVLFMVSLNSAVFAASASGQWGYIYNVYGYSYKMLNTIEITELAADAYVEIHCTSAWEVPANYMGVKGRLYNDEGEVVEERDWYYNDEPCVGIGHSAWSWGDYGERYYSDGITRVWNGTGYWTFGGVPSPSLQY